MHLIKNFFGDVLAYVTEVVAVRFVILMLW
jgi:hypothetical protein